MKCAFCFALGGTRPGGLLSSGNRSGVFLPPSPPGLLVATPPPLGMPPFGQGSKPPDLQNYQPRGLFELKHHGVIPDTGTCDPRPINQRGSSYAGFNLAGFLRSTGARSPQTGTALTPWGGCGALHTDDPACARAAARRSSRCSPCCACWPTLGCRLRARPRCTSTTTNSWLGQPDNGQAPRHIARCTARTQWALQFVSKTNTSITESLATMMSTK